MAKITIELDTAAGDTLQEMLAHLIVHHAPSAALVSESIPSRLNPSVGDTWPAREEIVAAGKAMVEEPEMTDEAIATHLMVEKWAEKERNKPRVADAPLTEYDGERKRGLPGPSGRRTKLQIETDKLYFEQVEAAKAEATRAASGVPPVTFKTFESPAHAVAAMEAGVHEHDKPDVDSEDDAGDAEDEAAETAQRALSGPTLDDLRTAYMRYSAKFGTPAAIKDVKTILGCGVADVPADKIPEALAKLEAAIAAPIIDKFIAEAEVARKSEPKPAPTATKAELLKAIMAYGKKYDGTEKPDDMVFAKEDLPKVFTETFGVGVTGLGSIPEQTPEAFGKILAAIVAATAENRFKREVRK